MTDLKDIPFDNYVRFVLNSGNYLDTFGIGSIKIDPICWPTKPRKKLYDICTKFEGSTSLKNKSTDDDAKVQGKEKKQSVVRLVPNSVKVPNKRISAPKQTVTPTLTKKEEEDVNGKVNNMVNKVSVSKSPPQYLPSEKQSKLECTKRKLREQYEQIKNEKKR